MKQQTKAKQYIEPTGFKGTKGEWIQKTNNGKDYLLVETLDKNCFTICKCQMQPFEEIPKDDAEANAKLISQSKELAKALQEITENAAPVPDYPGEFFLHKLSLENAKQVLKEALT